MLNSLGERAGSVQPLIKIGQWYTIEVPLKIPFNTIQWYLLVIRPTVFWTVYFTIENHWKYHSSNGILNGIPRGIEWYTIEWYLDRSMV